MVAAVTSKKAGSVVPVVLAPGGVIRLRIGDGLLEVHLDAIKQGKACLVLATSEGYGVRLFDKPKPEES